MTYRVAIAGFQHETNTFAPTRATLDLFIKGEGWPPLTEGKDIVEVFSPMNIPIGGFMNAAKPKGWELHPIVWAAAAPSSYVSTEAFEYVAGKITAGIAALKGRIDAVYLDLHGAMVTEAHEDGEGELLRRVRAIVGPDMPIGVSLDLHANVTPEMVQHSDVLIAYRTYPHLDMAVTGARVLRHMEKLLTGERKRQAKAFRQIPFLIPLTAQCTFIEPCKSLYDSLGEMERGAVSSLSFSPGFHPADIHHCGPTVVAYGDTQEAADKAAEDFARQIVEREAEFKLNLLTPRDAIDRARQLIQGGARKSIVLADVQDNPGTGATSDTTGLLAALVAEHVPDATLGLLYDPEVAKIAHQAGENAEIEVSVGGKLLDVEGARPYRNRFRVAKLGDGRFLCTGPFYKGTRMDLGLMARLQVNGVDLVIASARVQAADKDQYRHLGIEPGQRQIVGVKSTVHFRGDFTDIAHDILNVESPGAFIERAETLPYRKLRRGMKLSPKGRAF
jgi:microcystin degradation protein MlrC